MQFIFILFFSIDNTQTDTSSPSHMQAFNLFSWYFFSWTL